MHHLVVKGFVAGLTILLVIAVVVFAIVVSGPPG
jgi:hypothetical protein